MTDLLAVATVLVAIFTAVLALSTRALARSSAADQRSQWRPIIIPGDQTIDESIEGELCIELRNVGRGPALGLHGELRRGDSPYAASIPDQVSIVAPDERLWTRFRLPDPPAPRGAIIRARLSYYDVAEQWHHTDITMGVRRPEDADQPVRVAEDQRRRIGPIPHGRPRLSPRCATGSRAPTRAVDVRLVTHPRAHQAQLIELTSRTGADGISRKALATQLPNTIPHVRTFALAPRVATTDAADRARVGRGVSAHSDLACCSGLG